MANSGVPSAALSILIPNILRTSVLEGSGLIRFVVSLPLAPGEVEGLRACSPSREW